MLIILMGTALLGASAPDPTNPAPRQNAAITQNAERTTASTPDHTIAALQIGAIAEPEEAVGGDMATIPADAAGAVNIVARGNAVRVIRGDVRIGGPVRIDVEREAAPVTAIAVGSRSEYDAITSIGPGSIAIASAVGVTVRQKGAVTAVAIGESNRARTAIGIVSDAEY